MQGEEIMRKPSRGKEMGSNSMTLLCEEHDS